MFYMKLYEASCAWAAVLQPKNKDENKLPPSSPRHNREQSLQPKD